MDIFNREALKCAREQRDEYRQKYYDLQETYANKVEMARNDERLKQAVDTQTRLNNLYSELMSYKFRQKK